MNIEKNRELTEKKILDAVGIIIKRDGFEKIGINAIASEACISKVLIYRYFETVDNLIVEYLSQNDFWISFSIEFPKNENLREFMKQLFRNQITQMRNDKLMRRLQRWELNTQNGVTDKLRLKRESKNITLITIISQLSEHPQEEVAAIATIISSAITYLCLFSETCPIYNGIDIQSEKGWQQISSGIDLLIDKWCES